MLAPPHPLRNSLALQCYIVLEKCLKQYKKTLFHWQNHKLSVNLSSHASNQMKKFIKIKLTQDENDTKVKTWVISWNNKCILRHVAKYNVDFIIIEGLISLRLNLTVFIHSCLWVRTYTFIISWAKLYCSNLKNNALGCLNMISG